jgi:TonB-dependent starch-binding outer membrane protein SusC
VISCIVIGRSALAGQDAGTPRAVSDTQTRENRAAAPPRTMTDLLVARVPGVVVYPTSGVTGAGARVRIRGHASLYLGNRPVVYLDGLRVEGMLQDQTIFTRGTAPLDDFNPEDVDSIVIVRGPAAGGLYGPEAASGVILLYTARGSDGPPRWHVYAEEGRLSVGAELPPNYRGVDASHPDSLNQNGRCTLLAHVGGRCMLDFVRAFDPLSSRSQFRSSPRRRVGVGVAGGVGRMRYAGGVGVERETGIYELSDAEAERLLAAGHQLRDHVREPSDLRRMSVRAMIDAELNRTLRVGMWASGVSRDLRLGDDERLLGSGLGGYSYAEQDDGWRTRPGELFQILNSQEVARRTGGARLTGEIGGFLTVEALAGRDVYEARELRLVRNGEGPDTSSSGRQGFVTVGRTELVHGTLSLTATAAYRLGSGLRARSVLGVRHTRRDVDASRRDGSGLPPGSADPNSAAFRSGEETRRDERLVAFFAEQRFSWRDRVVASVGMRGDRRHVPRGETVLHPSLRLEWATADPAHGLLDRLDLHAAYGTADQRIAGSSVHPERTSEVELGIHAKLANGRTALEATFYSRRLVDGVAPIPDPLSVGIPTFENVARVDNTGLELSILAALVRSERLDWDVSVAAWGNRNRVKRPPTIGAGAGGWGGHVAGYPLAGYWGVPFAFSDTNRNGLIEAFEITEGSTPVFLGMPFPSHGVGLSQSITLAGRVRVTGLLEYRAGHHLYNGTAWQRCVIRVCREAYDRSLPLNLQAAAVALWSRYNGSGFVEKADFVKLREVAATVTLPRPFAARVGAQTASITIAGRNLATWTKYSGPDPEVNGSPLPEELDYHSTTPASPGFATEDRFVQPAPRVWTLRVDLRF